MGNVSRRSFFLYFSWFLVIVMGISFAAEQVGWEIGRVGYDQVSIEKLFVPSLSIGLGYLLGATYVRSWVNEHNDLVDLVTFYEEEAIPIGYRRATDHGTGPEAVRQCLATAKKFYLREVGAIDFRPIIIGAREREVDAWVKQAIHVVKECEVGWEEFHNYDRKMLRRVVSRELDPGAAANVLAPLSPEGRQVYEWVMAR